MNTTPEFERWWKEFWVQSPRVSPSPDARAAAWAAWKHRTTVPEVATNKWRDLAHEAFLQLEYLHQRERQHSSTGAVLLRLSEALGFPVETSALAPQPERTRSPLVTKEKE
jgi:hypothetical protein